MSKKIEEKRHFVPEWAAIKNVSQVDLVNGTGADKSIVSRWFSGNFPSKKYSVKIAEVFGIKESQLFLDPNDEFRLALHKWHEKLSELPESDQIRVIERSLGFIDGVGS